MSVAALLPGFGSLTPAGTATVAVFASVPVAAAARVATSVYVAVPPGRSETVEAMFPIPLAAPQPEPAEAAHVHVTDVSAPGTTSLTGAFTTPLGPAFATTIVYVTVAPGTAVGVPSVFVIERSAWRTSRWALVPNGFEPIVVTRAPAPITLS